MHLTGAPSRNDWFVERRAVLAAGRTRGLDGPKSLRIASSTEAAQQRLQAGARDLALAEQTRLLVQKGMVHRGLGQNETLARGQVSDGLKGMHGPATPAGLASSNSRWSPEQRAQYLARMNGGNTPEQRAASLARMQASNGTQLGDFNHMSSYLAFRAQAAAIQNERRVELPTAMRLQSQNQLIDRTSAKAGVTEETKGAPARHSKRARSS